MFGYIKTPDSPSVPSLVSISLTIPSSSLPADSPHSTTAMQLLIILTVLPFLIQAMVLESRAPACVTGFYIIHARGTFQNTTTNDLKTLANRIASSVPSSVTVENPYDAFGINIDQGVNNTRDLMKAYISSCKSAKKTPRIALLGYSQGANIVTNTISGESSGKPPAITDTEAKSSGYPFVLVHVIVADDYCSVVAVAVFGDPTYTSGETFDVGNATGKMGWLPSRSGASLTKLRTYSALLRSYCTQNDEFCSGSYQSGVHDVEVRTWGDAAFKFITSKA